ncbi:MAG: hypothetical protein R3C53_15655 [Pirellulaceae bacterium]
MNRVNRTDGNVNRDQCSVFNVDSGNRPEWPIIGRELAWCVADVEDVGDAHITKRPQGAHAK